MFSITYTLRNGTAHTILDYCDEELAGRIVAELRRCVDVVSAWYCPAFSGSTV